VQGWSFPLGVFHLDAILTNSSYSLTVTMPAMPVDLSILAEVFGRLLGACGVMFRNKTLALYVSLHLRAVLGLRLRCSQQIHIFRASRARISLDRGAPDVGIAGVGVGVG
jgi:hypothetical protein